MSARCTTSPITTAAMMGKGTHGVCTVISAFSQSGALPPGDGRIITAMPSHTKESPSVTTMEGRFRTWMSAPTAP